MRSLAWFARLSAASLFLFSLQALASPMRTEVVGCRTDSTGRQLCVLKISGIVPPVATSGTAPISKLSPLTAVQRFPIVFKNTPTPISGFVEIDQFCRSVSSGTYSVRTPPLAGTITTAIVLTTSAALYPDLEPYSCATTILPFNILYYTWTTDDSSIGATDYFVADWSTPSGGNNRSIGEIKLGGIKVNSVDFNAGTVSADFSGPYSNLGGEIEMTLEGPTASFTRQASNGSITTVPIHFQSTGRKSSQACTPP